MIIFFHEVKELLDEFNALADTAQNIAIFTRDIELQRRESANIGAFIKKAEDLKNCNKKTFPEDELNLIGFLIYTIDAVKAELQMIISLKNNEVDAAWACLVLAQSNISIAASNHPFNADSFDGFVAKLSDYEKTLFPKMMFASVGSIIKIAKCSICREDYEDCEHLKGKLYKGELCFREIHEAEIEEVSAVEKPADKLCRQLAIGFEGKEVDILTLMPKIEDGKA